MRVKETSDMFWSVSRLHNVRYINIILRYSLLYGRPWISKALSLTIWEYPDMLWAQRDHEDAGMHSFRPSLADWGCHLTAFFSYQPYVDLSRGDADANTSLLLDYTNSPKFIVWIYQTKNRHTVALLSTLVLLMLLASQPLCASLFTIRDTEFLSKSE